MKESMQKKYICTVMNLYVDKYNMLVDREIIILEVICKSYKEACNHFIHCTNKPFFSEVLGFNVYQTILGIKKG